MNYKRFSGFTVDDGERERLFVFKRIFLLPWFVISFASLVTTTIYKFKVSSIRTDGRTLLLKNMMN